MTLPPDQHSSTYYLTCMKCHYRLRGLPPGGACPECGTPIAQSIQWWGEKLKQTPWWRRRPAPPGPLLHTGDARWLRQVVLGTWGLAAMWTGLAAWMALRATSPWKSLAPDYMLLAVGLMYFISAWLLTASERRADVPARWDAARWVLRGAAFGVCTATFFALRAEQVPAHNFPWYTTTAVSLGMLLIPPSASLTFLYLGHLAARVPDGWPAVACRTLGYAIATIFVGPCCLTGGANLRPLYNPGHQYSYDPATLGDMLGNLGRTCSETRYVGYGFVLVLLLKLAWDFLHSAARRGAS